MDPMNIYGDIFAEVYNLYWTEFIDIIAPQILSIFETQNIENRKIMDLCCGTGRLAKIFLEKGYTVHGLDLSEDMINLARKKTESEIKDGKAEFTVGDAVNFELDKKFGLIVSTFDSLNHLKDLKALKNCFRQVRKHLVDDGLFIFDLNTERGLKKWQFVDVEDHEDTTFILHGAYDKKERKAYSKVFGFQREKDDLWRKFEEKMYNTVFDMDKVKKTLEKVGFKNVYFTKETELETRVDKPEKEDRVFIFAQK